MSRRIMDHAGKRVLCSSGKLAWPSKASAKRKLKRYQARGARVRAVGYTTYETKVTSS